MIYETEVGNILCGSICTLQTVYGLNKQYIVGDNGIITISIINIIIIIINNIRQILFESA